MRILIADDEPLARKRLRMLLEKEPDADIIAECEDGEEAVAAVHEHRPEVAFLDIQMPALDGIGVAEALQDEPTRIVFVTAYDQHAVRAFELHAVDYLLKPFNAERLAGTLQRLRERLQPLQPAGPGIDLAALLKQLRPPAYADRFAIKLRQRVYYVRTDEIDWIEAEGNYVKLHAAKKEHLLRRSVSALEEELDPGRFVRVHRSAIINLDRLKELRPLYDGEFDALLQDGTKVKVSRTYRENLPDF